VIGGINTTKTEIFSVYNKHKWRRWTQDADRHWASVSYIVHVCHFVVKTPFTYA
jgi:hypothetical protein